MSGDCATNPNLALYNFYTKKKHKPHLSTYFFKTGQLSSNATKLLIFMHFNNKSFEVMIVKCSLKFYLSQNLKSTMLGSLTLSHML